MKNYLCFVRVTPAPRHTCSHFEQLDFLRCGTPGCRTNRSNGGQVQPFSHGEFPQLIVIYAVIVSVACASSRAHGTTPAHVYTGGGKANPFYNQGAATVDAVQEEPRNPPLQGFLPGPTFRKMQDDSKHLLKLSSHM
eukprot:1177205-Prorocentrum_minimum.AAC.1